MGSLFFWDFSQIRFSPAVGGSLPRRQRVQFNGLNARDDGTTIQIDVVAPFTPEQYGAVGDGVTDDSSAVQAAINAINVLGGGKLYCKKTYAVQNINLCGGLEIYGDGRETGFIGVPGYSWILGANIPSGGSSDPSGNMIGIKIRNISVSGTVATQAFAEHTHNIALSAVTDVLVEDCVISGFRGDGIYLGSGTLGGVSAVERHNVNVRVVRCEFDGVNSDNRNGISVIDCDTLLVDECYFIRCTKSTMPGPIDLEPDHTYNVIRNVTIRRPKMRTCGGNVGAIGGIFPDNDTMTTPITSITIDEPDIEDCAHGIVFSTTSSDIPHKIRIYDPRVRSGSGVPLGLYGIRDAIVHGGDFSEWDNSVNIGYDTSGTTAKDVVFRDTRFYRLGRTSGIGLSPFFFDGFTLDGITIEDCGLSGGGAGDAIKLNSTGGATTSSRLKTRRVRVIPGTRTTVAVNTHASHTSDGSSNHSEGCDWGGLESTMPAYKSDDETLVGSYTTSTLPDSFPLGRSVCVVNNSVTSDAGAPDAFKQGILETYRYKSNTGYRKFTFQRYYPAENTVRTRVAVYMRHGSSASNAWLAWSLEGAQVEVSETRDVGSIANGASYTSPAISYPGAEFGDFIEASCSVDLLGLSLTAYVSAADTVKYVLVNNTGGAVDLPSANFYLKARKRAV